MTATAVPGLPRAVHRIKLIATDLDGTLLHLNREVTPRTCAAIRAAFDAGLIVVAATGRQFSQLPESVLASGIRYVVGSNGAIGVDLADGRILFEELLAPQVAADIVAHLTGELEGVRFSAVRDAGARHAAEPGYLDLVNPAERKQWIELIEPVSLAEVVSQPTLKLTVRHPSLTADELLSVLDASGLQGFHATTSGAPFLEVQGPGVTKATGVARLCGLLGVDASEVMSAGDARNDVELLVWAAFGVAMGNAVPEAIAAADWTTARNDEDGLALVIEQILEARRLA
ncbi:MAG: HAD hydrolase family protein [Propionicimonas sp.]